MDLSDLSYDRILLLVSGFSLGAIAGYRLLFGRKKRSNPSRDSEDFWAAVKRRNTDGQ